jgi:hypothetical protein
MRSPFETWLFAPVPRARIAWFRTLAYAFVWVDVLVTTSWVRVHRDLPTSLYAPLAIGRLLHLPTPTRLVCDVVLVGLLAASAVAVTGRWPRLAGAAVAVLYLEWMVIAMSYGKVDHDRFGFLVALAVLPTVGAASHRDRTPDERAGWAMRCVELGVVATYVLAVLAKHRFGGGLPNWVDSTTFLRAVARRGTFLADPFLRHPGVLHAAQYGLVAIELFVSPLLLFRNRVSYAVVVVLLGFHLVTFAMLGIVFLPHCVCLVALLPLERLPDLRTPGIARSDRSPGYADLP